MRTTTLRWLAATLLVAACTSPQPPKATVRQLADEYTDTMFRLNPIYATLFGDNRYNDTLTVDIGAPVRAERQAFERDLLQRVQALDTAGLSEADKHTYTLLRFRLETDVKGHAYEQYFYLQPIHQMDGVHTFLAQLGSGASIQPFDSLRDYDAWLKRAGYAPAYLDTVISNMRQGLAAGITLPKAVMPEVIGQVKALLVTEPTQSVFWQPMQRLPKGTSAADSTRLAEAFRTLITTQLTPAYQRLHDFLVTEYEPKTRSTSGYGALPGGKEAYAYYTGYHTTTTRTPRDIHETGLAEVARIRSEMDSVRKLVGFRGDLKAFFADIRTNPKLRPFKTEAEIIQRYETIGRQIAPKVQELFPIQPKTPMVVREVEAFREAGAAGGQYFPGTPDGKRAGVFYVKIVDPKQFNSFDMEDLYLHEAVPGHHFQVMLALEQQDVPRFRQTAFFTAFEEGWALYAESLGRELGLYTDPYQYMGRLSGEMHRAVRLVVDTGIHELGWSREQALQFALDNEAETADQLTSEIERYMVMPGQALAYKTGELKIKELRKRAEDKLGSKFNVGEFHALVIGSGSQPLGVLESRVDGWIARQSR